jgi:hypothetical protein
MPEGFQVIAASCELRAASLFSLAAILPRARAPKKNHLIATR